MADADFDAEVDYEYDEEFGPGDDFYEPPQTLSARNQRYSNAYGDYNGGYGPGAGFGPRGGFGPPPGYQQGPSSNYTWGRGFGPSGPPMRRPPRDDRPIKYLIRCGIPKEHLRNLPYDMLQLIQPQYCGICAQHFISFTQSRLHYISKNHLKIQKKWLTHRYNGGVQHPKEAPLRSRELYCELCDVHITSKTHADSHYAGRPHRSIVEGRKQPRNPLLLPKSKAARLDQLIRREKKSLKPIEENEDDELKETKPVDSELYCDICKTSMTCSDQMTMHLNGKKHLAKEKRHIFDMMKGKPTDADNSEAYAEEKDDGVIEVKLEELEEVNDEEDWPSGEQDLY